MSRWIANCTLAHIYISNSHSAAVSEMSTQVCFPLPIPGCLLQVSKNHFVKKVPSRSKLQDASRRFTTRGDSGVQESDAMQYYDEDKLIWKCCACLINSSFLCQRPSLTKQFFQKITTSTELHDYVHASAVLKSTVEPYNVWNPGKQPAMSRLQILLLGIAIAQTLTIWHSLGSQPSSLRPSFFRMAAEVKSTIRDVHQDKRGQKTRFYTRFKPYIHNFHRGHGFEPLTQPVLISWNYSATDLTELEHRKILYLIY